MKRLLIFVLLFASISFNGQSQSKNFIDQPYIEVNGYADTLVIPNEIYIKIIISERDNKDKVSVEEIETKMVDSLKQLGINTEKDLSTNDLGSNYRFYLLKKRDVMKSKQYILKVNNAVMATKVFMLLEDLEISNVSIERVNHSQIEDLKNITRTKAVENARNKGLTLTRPLGQSLGSAIFITDNEVGSGIGNSLQGRAGGIVVSGYRKNKYEGELPRIEFEKINVSSTVNVKFILK